MTPEQMELFIKVLQHGFSTGAISRFDCLRSFIRAYPDHRSAVLSAAAAFERGCYYCPEQQFALAEMTDEQFAEWVIHTS